MATTNEPMTGAQLVETLSGIEGASELPIRISNYEGDHGMRVFSIRKHVITDENGDVSDAYVVING